MKISFKRVPIIFFIFFSSTSYAWQTHNYASQQGQVYIATKKSITDPSVSLVIGCIAGQSNATVSIDTANFIIGSPNHTIEAVFDVGTGNANNKGSGPSLVYSRVREDGMGFYIGEGSQGLGIATMISRNDWIKIYWSFVTPSRGKLLNNILGQPEAKPQKHYVFDVRGFHHARDLMAKACGWSWVR
jgi:hypothetical protein